MYKNFRPSKVLNQYIIYSLVLEVINTENAPGSVIIAITEISTANPVAEIITPEALRLLFRSHDMIIGYISVEKIKDAQNI